MSGNIFEQIVSMFTNTQLKLKKCRRENVLKENDFVFA
jgi:hypothetical protein